MNSVVVVEDHVLVRQSLIKVISGEEEFDVVGEAGNYEDAVVAIAKTRPDMALLDIEIPGGDGLEVAAEIKRTSPETRVIVLTMHDDEANVRRAMSLGVAGFVPKSASTEELVEALNTVASGGSYLSPPIAKRVMDLAGGRGGIGHLTDRELEILQQLALGLRPQELAEKFFLSVKTIKNHLTSIYAKLGVETGAQAVAEAYRQGIFSRRSTQ